LHSDVPPAMRASGLGKILLFFWVAN
jgi:hypothetical protein